MSEELTPETRRILGCYLNAFSTPDGKVVLADLKKSYFDPPFAESKINDLGYLVKRATEHNVYLKIVRMIERAAEEIQRTEGITPAQTPRVITDEPDP